ncbi:unnamed protein product [Echinostoma caproni]|uniref:Reverse transcriptase domain-containing protein n=1 Tax=Echinostoma caproni TaxID=27848 RepID=A0A183B7S6_9TREM|nr:unnamed protein product [Echinostoma caproni]
METALSSCEDSGIDLLPGGRLSDLDYADDIVLLSEDPDKLQTFLDNLNTNVAISGMRFAPSKCKMLLQDWVGPAPSLILPGEPEDESVYVNLSDLPYDLMRFNISAKSGSERREARKALLLKMGAAPPKKQYINYKTLMRSRKEAKMQASLLPPEVASFWCSTYTDHSDSYYNGEQTCAS